MGGNKTRNVAAATSLISMSLVACSALISLHEPRESDRYENDGDVAEEAHFDQTLPEAAAKTIPDAGSDAGCRTPDSHGCPSSCGPAMVRIQESDQGVDFCIDSTEVTTADYRIFADSVRDGGLAEIGATLAYGVCAKKFLPPVDVDSVLQIPNVATDNTRPVTDIGWCQAQAYCAWAGKRLCGSLDDGGPHPVEAPDDTLEWIFACKRGGVHQYSYGDTAEDGFCNTQNEAGVSGVVEVVQNRPNCVGGYAGLYDMLGNVSEWENGYQLDNAGIDDPSYVAARGSWFESAYTSNCDVQGGNPDRGPRDTGLDRVGIRCCATPVTP